MRDVRDVPPLFAEIDAAFNVRGKPVIYAWGDKIYNPMGVELTPELIAHESVHGQRQGNDIEGWWRRYIADPHFRLLEEIPAHVDEFVSLCLQHRSKWVSQRAMRRTFAAHVARRLMAPLYGYGHLMSFEDAKKALMAG